MAQVTAKSFKIIEGKGKEAREAKRENPLTATVEYNFGNDLDEAIALHGAANVFSVFTAQGKVDVQAAVRNYLDHSGAIEGAQAVADEVKLGAAQRQPKDLKGELDKLIERISGMPPGVEKDALKATLREKLGLE